jgi:prophage antirepressor-like protein
MNQISVFNFRTTEVRTVAINGEVWFVASDIAKALDYAEAKDMTRVLDEDEKGRHIVPTPSGEQEMIVINESGMYHAVLKSRKPEAKPFRKWVTSEVLPAIRKTGKYEAAPYSVNPGDSLTKEQADTLRQMQKEAAEKRFPDDTKKQGAFMLQGWSKLKAHFKVSYRQIPQAEFTEAVSLLARHVIEGEYLPAPEAATVNSEISDESLSALALREMTKPGRRFITIFGQSGDGLQPILYAIPAETALLTNTEIVKYIGEAGAFPRNLLPDVIKVAVERLAA